MSLQARLTENDQRLYSANRDVAHNFRFVVTEVADRLQDNRWPELHVALGGNAPSQFDMGEAAKAFITFVAAATENPKESMLEVLERSGWRAVYSGAQVAYMAMLGTVMAGIYFNGARAATLGGQGPCDDMATLIAAGREACKLIAAPRWKRPFMRLRNRVLNAVRAFRGR